MRVLVCGSRDLPEACRVAIDCQLDLLKPECIIEGGATGADTYAKDYALKKGLRLIHWPAQWDQFGKSAGPIRNAEMLSFNPDLVVAFYLLNKLGPGTSNMIKQARVLGVPVSEQPMVI